MKNATIFIRISPKGTYHFVITHEEGTNLHLTDRIRDWDTAKEQARLYVTQFELAGLCYDLYSPKGFNIA